jgi:hypothetical protein
MNNIVFRQTINFSFRQTMHFLGTANLSAMINNDINPFLHLAFPACCKFSAFFCNFQGLENND